MDSLYDRDKTCCFTGHRRIPWESLVKLKTSMEETISILAERGFTTFISGGAIGFDMLAAQTVLQLKKKYPQIRLVLALPCRNQHAKWSIHQQEAYTDLLDSADEVVCLSESYYSGCMHARNRYMVDNSSLCIAYMTRASGGTAYTVRYAEQQGVETINVAYLII